MNIVVKMPERRGDWYLSLSFNDIKHLKCVLQNLETIVFLYLKYPRVTYKKGKLVSIEQRDQEFIGNVFMYLFSAFRPFSDHPMLKVVRHYESCYKAHKKLHDRKPIHNFYPETIKTMFFFVYEATLNIRDDSKRDEYFKIFYKRRH